MKILILITMFISLNTIASESCNFLKGSYGLESAKHATLIIDINDDNLIVAKYRSPAQPTWFWDEYYVADGIIHDGENFQSGQEYKAICLNNTLNLTQRWNDTVFVSQYQIIGEKLVIKSKRDGVNSNDQIFIRIE
ncbi:MAG TPA: hypothetical protein VI911_02580 [Patescibacteria group bacterium]|nr:MAG: hypothetical protein A2417_16425 [Bdellovibrionales bacterium RIFOXYC1_FULL_37_79]OFZ59166.1 MAG: hypothetical protein A2381_03830 [Bdellovibrionales bacterium RIFOXYB1_FULL_37_110]OFZ64171.1 MAG: hypothetical protein A2577_14860 [Bdellovibrionales bacterium RIFOXYD1_FULL_36_51]HLD89901.1 hypothetical protein [Patescibacteria group bacterium]